MVVCIPVTPDGQVGHSWGRADRVAVAETADGSIARWEEFGVGWDRLHDEDGEGAHHARIARFVAEHAVRLVIAGHMGPPMEHMLGRMGVEVRLGASGDARAAVRESVLEAGSR